MTAASRSLATALWRARFASGLLHHQMGHDPAARRGDKRRDRLRLRAPSADDRPLLLPMCFPITVSGKLILSRLALSV